MILELEFRVAIAYLLLLKFGFSVWGRKLADTRTDDSYSKDGSEHLFGNRLEWLAQALLLGPFVVLLADPPLLVSSQIDVPVPWRWIATLPAAASLLLHLWARRSQVLPPATSATDSPQTPALQGPYQWIRYPVAASDAMFYLSLACVSANWVVLWWCALGVIVLRLIVLPLCESRRRDVYGPAYGDYIRRTGMLLPQFGHVYRREYTVPKRFGMGAITAMLTSFAIVFGSLKYAGAPPGAYLFVASEFAFVCLTQIFFGSTPRGGSILAGALLLPFWVVLAMTIRSDSFGNLREFVYLYRGLSPGGTVLFYTFVFVFGGLLGYCIGAMAAGFFLVMDMFDQFRPHGKKSHAAGNGHKIP